MQIHDDDEVETFCPWFVLGDVGAFPVHRRAACSGETARLVETDRGEVDGGHGPAAFGEPDGIAAFTAAESLSAIA